MQTREEKLSYENLYELYVNQQMTTRELATHLGIGREAIRKKMNEYKMDKNTQLNYYQLNDLQHDLLIGNVLGDASLRYEGGNYRLRFSHAENQKDYCQFKLNSLVDFCKTKELAISDGNKKSSSVAQLIYYFNTRALPCFNKYGTMTTMEVLKELNLNSFVIWLMDDGYLGHTDNSYYYTLSVKRFTNEEIVEIERFLTNVLKLKYKVNRYTNDKDYTQHSLYFPVSETEKIANLILSSDFGADLERTMSYKIYKKVD